VIGVPSRTSDLARSSPPSRKAEGDPENVSTCRNPEASTCRNLVRQSRQRLLPIETFRAAALQPNTS
jgi:hypothetical protein